MSAFDTLEAQLDSVYSEIMWLARRPAVTPSMARAWYTHVYAGRLARHTRMFTGKVSSRAAKAPEETLRLEHHHRMQTTLTELVERHVSEDIDDASEFIQTILRCESVHIVTFRENYDVLQTKGDYDAAGVHLISWKSVAPDAQEILWRKMLKGRVANAADFRPAA